MKGTRAAIRYAKALLDLAKEQNIADAINADMTLVGSTIVANNDLKLLLESPIVKIENKATALKEIFANTNAVTTELINVLVQNKRITLLSAIAKEYNALFDHENGIQKAYVTTAVALTEAMNTQVLDKVKELTGKQAVIENTIDESILGGFVLRVGDIQYNASIANNFNKLKRTFSQN